jgi:nucleoside-diphosphate-sugar epimerase
MDVLVTGGAGFIGGRIAAALLAAGEIPHPDGPQPIENLTLFDVGPFDNSFMPGTEIGGINVSCVTGDISDPATVDALIHSNVGAIFHLSGVVSSGAEDDFDLGYRVNLSGMQNILNAARLAGNVPLIIFAGSIAVYGGEAEINDRTPLTPRTSYGTQKAICELLINDATRKGFIDGRSLRLSAVVVRPGEPNKAASGFSSTIIRDPLAGKITPCPVGPETAMPLISAPRVTAAFLKIASFPGEAIGPNRAVLLGALSPTAGEVVEALARVAGTNVAARVIWKSDPVIQNIVKDWPKRIVAARADKLGLAYDREIDDLIKVYIDDELGGNYLAEAP